MDTVRNFKLSKTKHVYYCGTQSHIGMPLIILKRKNWLQKVRIICAEFTKMVHRICNLHAEFSICWHRILTSLVLL